jgi:hypothetical protein
LHDALVTPYASYRQLRCLFVLRKNKRRIGLHTSLEPVAAKAGDKPSGRN